MLTPVLLGRPRGIVTGGLNVETEVGMSVPPMGLCVGLNVGTLVGTMVPMMVLIPVGRTRVGRNVGNQVGVGR